MKNIRKWKAQSTSPYGGMMRLGERADFPQLPPGTLVSITHGIKMNILQTIVSTLVNHLFILPSLTRNENLLYGEGHGNLMTGESLLITVWRGKGMVDFRDRRAHGWAKDHLTRFVFGRNVTAWFLTYTPKDHRIPSPEEARHLSETYGKMLEKGNFVRSATRPVFADGSRS